MELVLLSWLLSTAAAAPPPCESELNKIKDLLQVSCEEQGLTAPPAGLPPDTGLLLLASNRFQRFSLPALRPFGQLTELDLSNNSLAALETQAEAPLPALQSLFLSHNALGSLPALRGLPALTLLAVGHNGLARLPEGGFRAVGRLQELQLQGNRLRQLPTEVFRGLSDLRDLDLSDNELDALPAELLSGLVKLEILRLERNRLRRLPEGFFPEENTFGYVYLAGNPWRCDCRLAYLREWLLQNEFAVYTRVKVGQKEVTENEPESVRCQDPAKEEGTPVMLFQTQCRTLGDSDGGEEEEEEKEGQPSDPLTTPAPSTTTAVTLHLTSPTPVATTFAPRTTTLTPGAPSTSSATPSTPTTTSTSSPRFTSGHSTPRPQATTFDPSTAQTPDDRTMTSTTPLVPTTTTTSQPGVTTGHSTAKATTFDPSTTMVPDDPTMTSTTPSASTTTTMSSTGQSTPRPPATTFDPSTTTAPTTSSTLAPKSTSASSPETTTGPLTTFAPTTARLVSLAPTARCLCPATAHHRSPRRHRHRHHLLTWGGWLSSHCCPLRLALYLSCLALVALPSLALLCGLCCGHRPRRSAPLRAPEAHLLRYRLLRAEGGPREPWAGGGSLSKRRTFRVCKTFPVGHVSWLLVSLPAKPARPERSPREGRLSCYSLGRGGDALGAVRVRYATASL